MQQRTIREVRSSQASRDGDGVAIQRVSGMRHAGMDPFLLLDELRSTRHEDYVGGFPPHPHRGMQTLTYLKVGGIVHEDSRGNRGEVRGGGVQWMSAGRGIIHSEMPTLDSAGLHGFQLWVNLPAAEKMSAPRYRDIPGEALTRGSGEGFEATAIAGTWHLGALDLAGPLTELASRAAVLDLTLHSGAGLQIATGQDESLLAYVYDGGLVQAGSAIDSQQLVVTGEGDCWQLEAGPEGAGLLVLRGHPLREPVAHYGPFVMNTPGEIEQAIADYREGSLGND